MVILSIVILIQIMQRPDEEDVCDKFKVFRESALDGTIKSKSRDPDDHYNRTVIYENVLKETQRLDLSFDYSELYEVLNVGDTIRKESYSSIVFINAKSSYDVNFGNDCR
jgi:hypothetical protein